ncbi:MAG: OsmC family protein [bacterium]
MVQVKMDWAGGLAFEGTCEFGHVIRTDGGKSAGGNESGAKPTELLLYGIAGCTGIDIVRILEKQRQKLKSLTIEVKAHQGDEYPRPFHTIEVKHILEGEDLDPKKVAKAIELSESKYCVVSQTVTHPGKVTTSFEIK